jgi:hypothetical protein
VVSGSTDAELVAAGSLDDDAASGLQPQAVRVKKIGFGIVSEADIHHLNRLRAVLRFLSGLGLRLRLGLLHRAASPFTSGTASACVFRRRSIRRLIQNLIFLHIDSPICRIRRQG